MASFVLKRLGQFVLVVLGSGAVVFFLTHILGDPARLMLPLGTSEEYVQEFRRQMGFLDPLWMQFGRFAVNALQLDFGQSFWQRVPALDLVLDRLPATALLAGSAMAISLVIGIPLGMLSAWSPKSLLDRVITVFSFSLISIADFWLAIMLIRLLAIGVPLFKTSGYGLDLEHLALPLASLTARPLGRIIQLTRSTILTEINNHYVTTARAKGMAEKRLLFIHVLRNALVPVITLSTYDFGRLVAGSGVVIESIFQWPGIGQLAVDALAKRDFPLIQATVFMAALVVGLINMLVDLVYGLINPKIRFN